MGHRHPADLTSDDVYAPDPSFEECRQVRESAMKAHAEVSIVIALKVLLGLVHEPRQFCELTMSSWCGRRTRHRNVLGGLDQECAVGHIEAACGEHARISVEGSQLQCQLATTEESRGLEVQIQYMKAEFQELPGRRVYTHVER